MRLVGCTVWVHHVSVLRGPTSRHRLTGRIRLMRPSRASGSTIVSGYHCLVHDVNICSLAFQFGRQFTGGVASALLFSGSGDAVPAHADLLWDSKVRVSALSYTPVSLLREKSLLHIRF